jgi:Polyketide cyclase / dehydrase and lipid transport
VTQIVVAINIHRPIGAVFNYITTPVNWPVWHPASRAVSGAVDHSLLIGEQVTEEFVVGGRRGSCVWQVPQREVPYLWTITTSTPQLRALITYRLKARGENTLFEREFTYVTSDVWFWVLDFLVMRRRMNRESRIALERLRERLEQPASRNTV